MSPDTLDRIVQLALGQFTKRLCDTRDFNWGDNHGSPPSKGYIERKPFSKVPYVSDAPIAAWAIKNYDQIENVNPLPTWPKTKTDGMFFDIMLGNWGIARDGKRLSINWQIGPRFGRGFIFNILTSTTGIPYLGEPKPTWVS